MATTEVVETPDIQIVTEKRVCAEAGCDTVLSMYNKREWCALHQPMIIPRMRGTARDK